MKAHHECEIILPESRDPRITSVTCRHIFKYWRAPMAEPAERGASRLPMDESREHLMVRIARMTYQQDRTLTQIAAETGA